MSAGDSAHEVWFIISFYTDSLTVSAKAVNNLTEKLAIQEMTTVRNNHNTSHGIC